MVLKVKILLFIACIQMMIVATCSEATCGTQDEFCGQGPNSKECCNGFFCNVALDWSYAYCDEIVVVMDTEKKCPTQDEFCERGTKRKDCSENNFWNIADDDRYAFCGMR